MCSCVYPGRHDGNVARVVPSPRTSTSYVFPRECVLFTQGDIRIVIPSIPLVYCVTMVTVVVMETWYPWLPTVRVSGVHMYRVVSRDVCDVGGETPHVHLSLSCNIQPLSQ